jgi:hypothetical protein
MMVTLTTKDKGHGPWLVLKDGEWFFEWLQLSQNQGQQPRQIGPAGDQEPFRLPRTTVLRKAEREELIRWVKERQVVIGVKDAAEILDTVEQTIYRMVDRGTLGRVPDIRHVRIPLDHVINLAKGLNKDGSEQKP